MLGETKGTSAGGAAEAGKNLRVPGTNPFFFNDNAWQGNRLLELLETMPDLEAYLMNTGRVGGGDADERSKKVRIPDSAAIVRAIVEGTTTWEVDPDFGYGVAVAVPGVDPELLRPRSLYARQGRLDEYDRVVATLKEERRAYIGGFPALDPRISAAV